MKKQHELQMLNNADSLCCMDIYCIRYENFKRFGYNTVALTLGVYMKLWEVRRINQEEEEEEEEEEVRN